MYISSSSYDAENINDIKIKLFFTLNLRDLFRNIIKPVLSCKNEF